MAVMTERAGGGRRRPDVPACGRSGTGWCTAGRTSPIPTILDDTVVAEIKDLIPLAPLHNPGAVAGIEAARAEFDVPHVAVFDTAFFASLPPAAATYAIPADLARTHRIRRYGFHGTSHRFVSRGRRRAGRS